MRQRGAQTLSTKIVTNARNRTLGVQTLNRHSNRESSSRHQLRNAHSRARTNQMRVLGHRLRKVAARANRVSALVAQHDHHRKWSRPSRGENHDVVRMLAEGQTEQLTRRLRGSRSPEAYTTPSERPQRLPANATPAYRPAANASRRPRITRGRTTASRAPTPSSSGASEGRSPLRAVPRSQEVQSRCACPSNQHSLGGEPKRPTLRNEPVLLVRGVERRSAWRS
jgi:hypothetical protein